MTLTEESYVKKTTQNYPKTIQKRHGCTDRFFSCFSPFLRKNIYQSLIKANFNIIQFLNHESFIEFKNTEPTEFTTVRSA